MNKGVAWLLEQQDKDGSFRFAALKEVLFQEYPLGCTDLAILALLSCGVARDHDSLQRAMRYVLEHPSRNTYEAGLTLMAIDMYGSPSWERKTLEKMSEEQRKQYRFPRLLDLEQKNRLQTDTEFLLKNWGQGYWSYETKSGEEGDISNTQFAILGLKAASRSGISIPEDVFEKLLHVFLTRQSIWGKKVTYPKLVPDSTHGDYLVDLTANARGWGYWYKSYKVENDVTGSRTNIGLACIALCRDELLFRGSEDVKFRLKALEPRITVALTDGLAWLDSHFSVERNPGTEGFGKRALMPINGYWYYYYMYSLERTGALLPTKYIGRHDWYAEGAQAIVKRQKRDGQWMEVHPVIDTAFALLFLCRATTPSIFSAAR